MIYSLTPQTPAAQSVSSALCGCIRSRWHNRWLQSLQYCSRSSTRKLKRLVNSHRVQTFHLNFWRCYYAALLWEFWVFRQVILSIYSKMLRRSMKELTKLTQNARYQPRFDHLRLQERFGIGSCIRNHWIMLVLYIQRNLPWAWQKGMTFAMIVRKNVQAQSDRDQSSYIKIQGSAMSFSFN